MGGFVTILAAVIGSAIIVAGNYWVANRFNNKTIDKFDKDIGELKKSFSKLDKLLEAIYGKVKTFTNDASTSFPFLKESDQFTQGYSDLAKTYDGNSPIALTDYGKKLAGELGVQDTVETMLPKVLKRLPKDPSMMDVQKVCFDYALNDLLNDSDNDLRHKIERQVYEDKGIYRNTLMVYGIVFRDAVFKKIDYKV